MRPLSELDAYRSKAGEAIRYGGSQRGVDYQGCFLLFPPFDGPVLKVIADTGECWDHVSVSTNYRTPTWAEMEYVKRMFFKDDEVAMQLHVPPTDYINIHSYCLHLWRPTKRKLPMPPKDRV